MLLRELASLNAIFTERIQSIGVRLDAMDKAQALFHENLTRVPTEVDKAISHLKELHANVFRERFETVDERFTSVQVQFRELDKRTEQLARAGETALTAALNAQKEGAAQQYSAFGEATNKAELAFIKQIDQLVTLFQTGMKAFDEKVAMATKTTDDKIATLEKQLTLLIGTGVGRETQHTTQTTSSRDMVALIGLIIGALGMVGGIVIAVMMR